MDGHAPANPLRRSLPGSDRVKPERNLGAAKPPWRKAKRTSGRHRLKSRNRRMRTRMYGGVGGEEPRGFPLSRLPQPLPDGRGSDQSHDRKGVVFFWWISCKLQTRMGSRNRAATPSAAARAPLIVVMH